MVGDETEHLPADVVAGEGVDVEAVEEGAGGGDAGLFVAARADAPVDELGGGGLAEVVADRGEHQGHLLRRVEVVDALPGLVDDHEGMHPDVALRMPLGLLPAADEGLQLGKEPRDHPKAQGEAEPERRPPGLQQQLLDFAPDAFGGEVVEGDAAAEAQGGVVGGELEAGRELHGAQHPQAVVREGGGVHHPKASPRQVVPAPEGVDVLVAPRVPGDGVDREVAPPGPPPPRASGARR